LMAWAWEVNRLIDVIEMSSGSVIPPGIIGSTGYLLKKSNKHMEKMNWIPNRPNYINI